MTGALIQVSIRLEECSTKSLVYFMDVKLRLRGATWVNQISKYDLIEELTLRYIDSGF